MSTIDLKVFKCCMADQPEHFLEEPIVLTCDHFICTKCAFFNDESKLKCGKCAKINESEVTDQSISENLKTSIRNNLKYLVPNIHAKFSDVKDRFENECSALNVKMDNQFDFILDEAEIRIESLRAILEEIYTECKNELTEKKDKMERHIHELFNVSDLEADIHELEENLKNNNINEDVFYKLNSKYLGFCKKLNKLKAFDFKVNFDINDSFNIDKSSIGSFDFNYDSFINKIVNSSSESMQLNFQPFRLVEIKNDQILIGCFDDRCLALYDKDFNFIRKIDKINGIEIEPFGLTFDSTNFSLFFTNTLNQTIYKLDSELNLVKSIRHSDRVNFNDILINDKKLYACVHGKKCVDIFDLDLTQISSHYLNDPPVQIRIINDIACIQHSDKSSKTCFYKLPFFEKLHEYEHRGPTLAFEKWFAIYDENFYIYNRSGQLVKTLKNKNYGDFKYTNDGMNVIGNILYICIDGKKLSKIKL